MCTPYCVHYQLYQGQAISVEKGEPFDYCTDESDDPDE